VPVSCDMNVDDPTPDHGDTITVTYSVDGNDPVDPQTATISGRVVVGGVPYDLSTNLTLPGTPSAPVTYGVPACTGLSFVATADPAVYTSVVP
jgi:hypothetical protein